MNNVKQAVFDLLDHLPDQCTWDEVMYEIYVRQKIEAGLQDVRDGRTFSQNGVFDEFRNEKP